MKTGKLKRGRLKNSMSWIAENKYWLEHSEELQENLMRGIKYVRWMKDNNATEKESADHFGIDEKEFHKVIHGQIPPKNL